MKPVLQTRKEPNGDCLRACAASLLELPIEEVPDFTAKIWALGLEWKVVEELQKWLQKRGLVYLEVALPQNLPWNPMPATLCILLGYTASGHKHAIVGRCEDRFYPIFNPWPEAELTGVAAVGFILPSDPAMRNDSGIEWLRQAWERSKDEIQQMKVVNKVLSEELAEYATSESEHVEYNRQIYGLKHDVAMLREAILDYRKVPGGPKFMKYVRRQNIINAMDAALAATEPKEGA